MRRFKTHPLQAACGCALLAGVLLMHRAAPVHGQTSAAAPIHVTVNGTALNFPGQQPISVQNRVLVPLRGVFQALGANVDWNPADQTVIAHHAGTTVRLRAGSADASINGKPVTLDVPAQEYGGRVMVPLRFVSEAMGAQVRWMDATQTVSVQTGGGMAGPAAAGGGDHNVIATRPSGQDLFVQNCGNCHKIGDLGTGRIPLDHIGANRSIDWLEVQIRSPELHHTRMPAFPPDKLSDRDLHRLSRYLEDQK